MPAVASRASPSSTARTAPPGSATSVVGPLSSTTAPVAAPGGARRRSDPARRGAPVRRANSPSCGVSTVAAGRPQQRPRRRLRGERCQPVAVDDDRARARRRPAHATRRRRRRRRAEARPDDERAEALESRRARRRPTARRDRLADDLDRSARRRRRRAIEARPCRPRRASPPATRGGGAGHPRAAGDDPHRRAPLVGVGRARSPPRRRRRPPRRRGRVRADDVEADVGHVDRRRRGAAVAETARA